MLRKGHSARPEDALIPQEEIKDPFVADGLFAGVFTLELHSTATTLVPSQTGTFDATFS
jgi:hypothetical protein